MKTLSDSQRAAQQQAYMKSVLPFWGIAMPDLRKLCKQTFKAHPLGDKSSWLQAIRTVWDQAEHREEKHAALELLAYSPYRRQWLQPEDLPLIKYLIEDGAWWDYVDTLASNQVGYLLRQHPDLIKPQMYRWALEQDVWVRRTAILCQLKFKQDTDEALLTHAIAGSIQDSDFFARKGIGWALREYSKTQPQFVIAFVNQHSETLSGLSKREALKILLKQGVVQAIP